MRERRVAQDGQEPGRAGVLLRNGERAQCLPARHAGSLGGRLGTREVPAVVGVPQQRFGFHGGVAPCHGLHVDDPPGLVADSVGESAGRGMDLKVVNGRVEGPGRSLQAAADEMAGRPVARRGDREVINRPHQAVDGDHERVGGQEARIPEGGHARQAIKGQGEQGALPDVLRRAVFVVTDEGPLSAPGQVTAADAAGHRAKVTTEVQQRQVIEGHRGSFGERGQFGPGLRVMQRAGSAHAGQAVAAGRRFDVLPEPGHQAPVLGERGDLLAHVLAERLERRTVRAAHHDPAQFTQPVLIQRDVHRRGSPGSTAPG